MVTDWDMETLTDAELRSLLVLPCGMEGARYWIRKADKIRWLMLGDDDSEQAEEERNAILVRAIRRQEEHHGLLRDRRTKGNPRRRDLIESRMAGQVWRWVGSERHPGGFRDAVSGRKARIAHTIVGTQTGETLIVCASTLQDARRRLGVVLGWPP